MCGQPSDRAFLRAACGAGGSVGVWLFWFLTYPFLGAVSDLVRTRREPSGRVVGVCTPRGAMRWLALALLRAYSPKGPNFPAARSISVCWAALRCGVNIRAFGGTAPTEGHAGGRLCRGLCVPCTLWLLAMLRQVCGSSVHGVRCAVLYSIFGGPGPQVV